MIYMTNFNFEAIHFLWEGKSTMAFFFQSIFTKIDVWAIKEDGYGEFQIKKVYCSLGIREDGYGKVQINEVFVGYKISKHCVHK